MTNRLRYSPDWADTTPEATHWLTSIGDHEDHTADQRRDAADTVPATPTTCDPGCDCWGCAWTRSTQ